MTSAARVLLMSLLLVMAAAPAASAADGWSIMPSGGSRPAFYAEGVPGAVLQDAVSVVNRSGRVVTVRLSGSGVPVAFAAERVRVRARTRADVPFAVSARGDRRGEIVARDQDGRRVEVPVRLRVGGPVLSALTVEHVAVRGGRITYDLVNRGTTVLVPSLAVHVDGVFGAVLDRAPRALPIRLRPGQRLRLAEPWPDRPVLDSVDVRLTVTAAGGAHDSAGVAARFVPWGAVTGVAGAAVAGGALLLVRGRRRRTRDGEAVESPRTEVELTGAVT
ncbi:hypothetical protein [Streptomyces longisporus]|uniref:DUF916 domain-containing protein n=1 Tax=Streptomyces longisporus TaxID=1948 RepID=A0ABP5ZGZ0_STRLO